MSLELAKAFVRVAADTSALRPDIAAARGIVQDAMNQAQANATIAPEIDLTDVNALAALIPPLPPQMLTINLDQAHLQTELTKAVTGMTNAVNHINANSSIKFNLDQAALTSTLSQVVSAAKAATAEASFAAIGIQADTKGLDDLTAGTRSSIAVLNSEAIVTPGLDPTDLWSDLNALQADVASQFATINGQYAIVTPHLDKLGFDEKVAEVQSTIQGLSNTAASNPITLSTAVNQAPLQQGVSEAESTVRSSTAVMNQEAVVEPRMDLNKFRDDAEKARMDALALSGSLTAILGLAAAGPFRMLQGGLMSAGTVEQQTILLETQIGTLEETQKLLADLTTFAAKTPFEMPGIMEVTTGLVQFGERGEELMETLRILGDASGGTEEKFRLLGLVFNQVRGVGKLLTDNFRQLSTRGLISLQDIASFYGVATSEAQEMMTAGRVSFEDFRKILKGLTEEGGRFANMSEKQSRSLLGLISTFNDAKSIMIRLIATPLVPFFKGVLTTAISLTEKVQGVVDAMGPMASYALAGATAFATLGTAIAGATFAARFFGLTARAALIGSGIGILIVAAGAAFGYLVGKLMESESAMASIKGWFTGMAETITGYLLPAWEAISKVASMVWNFVVGVTTSAWNTIVEIFNAHSGTINEIWFLIKEIASNVLDGIIELWHVFVETLEGGLLLAAQLFNWAFGVFGVSIGEAFGTGLDWIKSFLDMVSLLTTNWALTWEMMKTLAQMVLLQIADKAIWLGNTITAAFMAAVSTAGGLFGDLVTGIVTLFDTAVVTIKGLFKGLWEAIKAGFSGEDMMGAFKDKFVEEFAKLEGEFPDIFGNATNTFSDKMADLMGPDSPLGEDIESLQQEANRLMEEMYRQREKERAERAGAKPGSGKRDPGVPDFTEKPEPKEEQAKELAKFAMESGRYGVADWGVKIQDMLLKSEKGELDQTRNDLLSEGIKRQGALLAEFKRRPAAQVSLS